MSRFIHNISLPASAAGELYVHKPQCFPPNSIQKMRETRVVDPYSFFTDPDPDPVDPDGGQYGSGYGSGSGSNPDPGL
jgi:hypothetical protein